MQLIVGLIRNQKYFTYDSLQSYVFHKFPQQKSKGNTLAFFMYQQKYSYMFEPRTEYICKTY